MHYKNMIVYYVFNNYLISEHYVYELIYVTLSLGGNP